MHRRTGLSPPLQDTGYKEKKREADDDGGLAERQDLEDGGGRDESRQRTPPPFPPQDPHDGHYDQTKCDNPEADLKVVQESPPI